MEHISDKKEAVEFLDKLKDKVNICDEAVWYIKVKELPVKLWIQTNNINMIYMYFLGNARQYLFDQP